MLTNSDIVLHRTDYFSLSKNKILGHLYLSEGSKVPNYYTKQNKKVCNFLNVSYYQVLSSEH